MTFRDMKPEEDWTMDPQVAAVYWAERGKTRNLARKSTAKTPPSQIFAAVAEDTGHHFTVINPQTGETTTQTRRDRKKLKQMNQLDEFVTHTCNQCGYTNEIAPGKYKYCRRCRRVRDQKRSYGT